MRPSLRIALCLLVLFAGVTGCGKDSDPVLAPEGGPKAGLAVSDNTVLGNKVWRDVNGDGIQGSPATEPGLPGVVVDLFTCAGTFVGSKITDATGTYLFEGIDPGSYKLVFHAPAGYGFTMKDQGTIDSFDSDADTANGTTACTEIVVNEIDLTWDAGLVELPPPPDPATIGDRVWNDADQDGIQDDGELGIEGITVHLLTCDGAMVAEDVTDANGGYLFENVVAGDYRIHFVVSGAWVVSPADQTDDALDSDAAADGTTACTTLTEGEADLAWDLGLYMPPPPPLPATIGDRVWDDADHDGIQDDGETGVQGITVQLLACDGTLVAEQITDASGAYLFENVVAGDYKIRFVVSGDWVVSPADQTDDALDSDAAADGTTACTTLTEGETDLTWDAGLYRNAPCLATIGDRVWKDNDRDGRQGWCGEPGIPGITVELYTCAGELVATTVTDAQGNYLFENVVPGSYKVRFVLSAGWTFTAPDRGCDDQRDSDALADGFTACTTLCPCEDDRRWDAGLIETQNGENCTRTIGYWKNHGERIQALLPVWLGTQNGCKSVRVNTVNKAIDILRNQGGSNGINKLYAQLLAAKLNIAKGADPSAIASVISAADDFLRTHNEHSWNCMNSQEKNRVLAWKDALDDYNNGRTGPGHCD